MSRKMKFCSNRKNDTQIYLTQVSQVQKLKELKELKELRQ